MGKLQLAASEAHERIIKERGEITFVDAFVGGYDYAKEELALTWEDMQAIYEIFDKMDRDNKSTWNRGIKEYFEEAANRFNELRHDRQPD